MKLKGFKDIKKEQITSDNIKGFIQGNFRKTMESFGLLPKYIVRQAEERLEQVKIKSPECYNNDKCIHCKCEVSAKVFEDRECEHGCYGPMLNEDDYNKQVIHRIYDKMEMIVVRNDGTTVIVKNEDDESEQQSNNSMD